MAESYFFAAVHHVTVNGRPINRHVMRAIRDGWASGNFHIHEAMWEHRSHMRRLHSAYPARWRRRG